MSRTRLQIRRRKALRSIEKHFKSLVKLIKDSHSPRDAFDLNTQRNQFAAWRARAREDFLNVFDDDTAYQIGESSGIYLGYQSLTDEGNRLFQDTLNDHSVLIQFRARVPYMPRVPFTERIWKRLQGFAAIVIRRYARGTAFLILLIIILIMLAILAPEAFARVVHALTTLQGE